MRVKRFKTLAILVMVVLFVLSFTLSPTFATERPKFIKIAASSLGGTWFPLCAATAQILNDNIKETIFTTTLGGAISNLKKIEDGSLYMGMASATTTYEATKGIEAFTKKTKKARTVGVYYTFPLNLVVRADSDIYSIKDLLGKNVSGGKHKWSTEAFFRTLLEVNGISYEDIKAKGGNISFIGWSQMRSMFKDKKLDFIIDPGNPPSAGITEITTATPIRLIDVGPEALEKVRKANPGYSTVDTPGGLYRGQEKPVVCIGIPAGMVISSDIADDLAYEITKVIFENTKTISKVHKVLKEFSIQNALRGAYLPLHPGAYKYYKEKGIAVPERLKP